VLFRSLLGCEGIKPGWIRVNFNYFISEEVFNFILEAVHLVATDGWKLLPWYRFDVDTAGWTHVDGRGNSPFSLNDVHYTAGAMAYDVKPERASESELSRYLEEAHELFSTIDPHDGPIQDPVDATASFDDLRWFLLPDEVRTGD
jgi:hypothetical protein